LIQLQQGLRGDRLHACTSAGSPAKQAHTHQLRSSVFSFLTTKAERLMSRDTTKSRQHSTVGLVDQRSDGGDLQGEEEGHAEEDAERGFWYTSMEQFKPLHHKLHRGKHMTAYFACSVITGEHFVLKAYPKGAGA
jgi:hypothetical protein